MSWADILKDTTKYPDATKLTLAEGVEVTLGDLRALSLADQQKVTQALADVTKQQDELKKAQLETANFYAELLEEQKKLGKGATKTEKAEALADSLGLDPALAPYLKPLVDKLETMDKGYGEKFKGFEDNMQKLSKGVIDLVSYYMQDKWDREFTTLSEREEGLTVDKLVKYATENRILDRMGMPDIKTAHERMSEPKRRAKLEQEAEQRGIEKGKKEAVVRPSVPRTNFIPPKKDNGKAAPASINEAVEAAFQDPEIAESFASMRR